MERDIKAKYYFEKADEAIFDNQPTLPNSIPSISGFVGREDYLNDLRESYQNGTRCFVLHGTGGVGKTATALKFAEEIADEYKAKIFVDMQGMSKNPLSARDAMFEVVRQFEREVPANIPDEQLKNLFIQFVQNQPALIVLDNAETKKSVEALKAVKACFIVTSRESFVLTSGKSNQILNMSPDDARKLLFEIAGEERFDGRANELAYLAGYLPMALKPLASILAEDELETIEDIIERYRDKQALLKERVPDYNLSLEETLTVGASFELSYERLSDEMKERWRRLSVFPADFDELAIVAVLEISEEEARETQKQLRRFSLLEVNPKNRRFSLHDLIRVFTDAKLSDDECFQTQFLHAKHYASIIRVANYIKSNDRENGFINALELIDSEWSNIITGQKWTADFTENDNNIAELCGNYAGDFFELKLRLNLREYLAWQLAGLTAARKLNNKHWESGSLGSLGLFYQDLGEYWKAIEYHDQALEISREIGNRSGEGSHLGNLGNVYLDLGELQKAIEYQEQALEISRETGDRLGEGNSLNNLGNVYLDLGEDQKAIDHYEQSLEISREIGDRLGEGVSLGNLGNSYYSLGEYLSAIEYYEKSLAIKREIGDRLGEGISLGNLGNAYFILGEKEKACGLWKEALTIFEAIESPEANRVRQLLKEYCED